MFAWKSMLPTNTDPALFEMKNLRGRAVVEVRGGQPLVWPCDSFPSPPACVAKFFGHVRLSFCVIEQLCCDDTACLRARANALWRHMREAHTHGSGQEVSS